MRYFIVSHNAALALLAHIPNPRFGDSEPETVSIAGACALLDQEAQEVIDRYDLGVETLDLLVPSRATVGGASTLRRTCAPTSSRQVRLSL